MKINGGRRHHVTHSVNTYRPGKLREIIGNIVLNNGLPVGFYFVKQTSINRPNTLLEFETFYRFNDKLDLVLYLLEKRIGLI